MKRTSPCKECTERKVGCHGECAKYEEFVAQKNAFNDKIYEEKRKEREFREALSNITRYRILSGW